MSELGINDSARRHDVADEDMRHAVRNAMRVYDLGDGFTMFIGPARDAALLEVGVADQTEGPEIVHSQPARDKYLRWLEGL
jgi:hypothetical protein